MALNPDSFSCQVTGSGGPAATRTENVFRALGALQAAKAAAVLATKEVSSLDDGAFDEPLHQLEKSLRAIEKRLTVLAQPPDHTAF